MGMGNGEWGMGSGEWGMENREWKMRNGEWEWRMWMGSGEWGTGNLLNGESLKAEIFDLVQFLNSQIKRKEMELDQVA